MANVWRRQPSKWLSSRNLVRKEAVDASTLVADDFFEPPTGFQGVLKRWTGAAWIKAVLKVFLGSWQSKPLKRWNGSQWVLVETA